MDASTDPSGQLRQNALTGRWVAVAPDRARRPRDTRRTARPSRPRFDPACPFCPGNEGELEAVLAETPAPDGGWATRVVPNRYPAFTNDPTRGEWVDARLAEAESGIGRSLALGSDGPVVLAESLPAVGYQEVIIDTPRHDRDLADMEPHELETILETYHDRYVSVSEAAPSCRVFLFRNRGREAGTSLAHAHGQLVATAVVPPEVRVREIRSLAFHGDRGRCLVCSLPEVEPAWDERTVVANDRFVAVVPWAAETPFEVWIVPREHQAEFGQASPEDLRALAAILSDLLGRLRDRADDPPSNLMIHSPRRSRAGSKAFHWTLQLRPRASQLAGFELASGVAINASSPTRDAATLRGDDAGDLDSNPHT